MLVDPERAKALLLADADENLAFLFRKQIEEADLICFSKSDLANEVPEIGARVRQISAKTARESRRGSMRFFRASLRRENRFSTSTMCSMRKPRRLWHG